MAFAIGLAKACELAVAERETHGATCRSLRDRLERGILANIPDAVVNARGAERAPHIANITVPGADGESMLMALDLMGIACSGGSACQSGSTGGSHVLAALDAAGQSGAAVRMSVGSLSDEAGIDRAIAVFSKLAMKARGMVPA